MSIDVAHEKLPPPRPTTKMRVHASALVDAQRERLSSVVAEISYDDRVRIRHGFGHAQSDIAAIRAVDVTARVPDAVCYPSNETECQGLIDLARAVGLVLLPFGGGTNVAQMLLCPTHEQEPRPIISVDMSRMCRVLWVDQVNGLARVEAGITGRALNEALLQYGVTMGHEPDSFEFSTLGGWVATKASGMKKNRYGNIEDIVREVSVLSAGGGPLWQHHAPGTSRDAFGRVACGVELKDLVIGSEGNFGLIVDATIRVSALPAVSEFDSVLLHSWSDGVAFMRDLAGAGANKPVSVRLVDNEQFRLGQVLKGGGGGVVSALQKMLVTRGRGFEPKEMVAVTLKLEGSADEVALQKKNVKASARRFGGMVAGASSGEAGYNLTYAIAYLRDFGLSFGLVAESFETFVNFSNLSVMVAGVKAAVREEHRARGIAGVALVSARITQLYSEGACVYFYYMMDGSGLKNPSAVFDEIEATARATILELGGSVSHHHGIGKHRARVLEEASGAGFKEAVRAVKDSLDPGNVFGARNGLCGGGGGGGQ